MSLWQIHHQRKTDPDGPTEMCAQREIESEAELRQLVEDVKVSHPLPDENVQYLAVGEGSPLFWKVPA